MLLISFLVVLLKFRTRTSVEAVANIMKDVGHVFHRGELLDSSNKFRMCLFKPVLHVVLEFFCKYDKFISI